MIRIVLFLALLITATVPLRAQEEFVLPPAKKITSMNFSMLTGGIVILQARVSAFPDTLNFILDTGSGGISLDSSTVERIRIPSELSNRTIRGIAGIRQVRFAYNNTLHLPGLSVDSLDFHINDYDILSSAYGIKIDGIIGYSFLSRYIVKVNYDSLKLDVYTRGTIKYPRGGFILRPYMVTIPIVNAGMRDERDVSARFYFDTGAGMCLLLSSDFVDDSAFIRKKRRWYHSQAEGLGGKAPMLQGVLREVRFGPYKFRNVPSYIFDDEYNVTAYPYLGGLIGNDLLRRFNIIINYGQRDMHLTPNTHFKDEFDYSYTGLGLYQYGDVVEVGDVMPGSPAEEAGFRSGDVLLSVNNNMSNNIQSYKNLMQTPGTKINIVVLRDDGPEMLSLKVKNIKKRK